MKVVSNIAKIITGGFLICYTACNRPVPGIANRASQKYEPYPYTDSLQNYIKDSVNHPAEIKREAVYYWKANQIILFME